MAGIVKILRATPLMLLKVYWVKEIYQMGCG